ncbi:MAG: DUF2723 domain-containing protein, partial [Anaerolineae bacterium]|nr:DUF2723 domain-containing protein [Anaerolineae bacterium]
MARRPERTRASLGSPRLALDQLWLVALWLSAFLLYAGTTALDILPADSGEFQLIAAGWGIGHPPGYSLYTIVAALWVRLVAIGALPWRANLLSAALAATTLVISARSVEVWSTSMGATLHRARSGGILAALALGTASTFWAQATVANIRMPTMLIVALGYLVLARYRVATDDMVRRRRALIELAIVTGLGVGHHPSLAFIAVGWAVYVLLITPGILLQASIWLRAALAGVVAWLLPQLYLPLRGAVEGAPLNPGDLDSWRGFWDHVLARGFGGDMLAFATPRDLALRLPLLPTLFRMQFPTVVLVAMAIGWFWLLRRNRAIAISLIIAWLVQTFFTITYRAPQTVEYLMPAYLPMALVMGLAIAILPVPGRHLAGRVPAAIIALVAVALLLQLPGHIHDFAALARDTSIRDRAEPLLLHAPAGATVLADWHWATPLWVLQAIEGLAPEVHVAYVYPEEGADYDQVWRTRAEDASGAVLFTTHAYTWEGWTSAPVSGGYRLYSQPVESLVPELGYTALDADLGPIRLLGFRWSGSLRPGATIELSLAWQAVGSAPPASFATRLWGDRDTLLSAADQLLDAEVRTAGVQFTTLTHQLPVDRCSSTVYPSVSTYTVTGGGFQDLGSVSLPGLEADCTYPTLPTERFWPGVVLGGGPYLRGVDYDTRNDGTALAYLHWCGPGTSLVIRQSDTEVQVDRLALGACRTVTLPLGTGQALRPSLSRPDGRPVTLVSLPWPAARPDERYVPFGAEMVLVGETLARTGSQGAVLTL